ncbi:bifunctional diaminohydroxyphosphoribosylaminopyrimidine deaminase/5-amino-6-(5-phosphoribosylamino)uracil reductase RibD [uncultured Chryseobacterium sp.]|uniref:bifunctional diaminohydroxyphosphoribosylaminopyrimidine deaminase/5-amino-6-(5-phosphoribosylamino)uracil reductase RibD n=1 Tax=uncultured Chryseobacterium sp. TaxID=259322 RepID=UPI0025F336ED|nr:bifunctional diaminohydroxyphosphoribosylaminopyrimidine deaminase/5-amino-6-(5-phosphoribosylamino)uracil reductase RibD [uncultured Chryseobacterium sp.]
MEHELYLKRGIELAKKALGKTYPNPFVGSVIVHNGKIIGEGYHRKAGENHAEINAIESVEDKSLIPESTIYVTLEPCAHYGKTPPCALKIKELGFRKVVIGAMDSHDKVNGKGKKIIQDAGIEVISGILAKECIDLNKRFFTYHEKKRPYIILKWAQSADGFLDKDFKPTAISNALVNQFVHQLRADEHAILVGTQTALNDDPSLTVRNGEGVNPVRILIDLDLKVPSDFKIYNTEAKTIVINSLKEEIREHIHFIKIKKGNFIQELMDALYREQIQSVIIEGGRFTLQQFIDGNLWDEALIIKNENLKLENGTEAPELPGRKPLRTDKFRDNSIEFYQADVT